MMSSPSPTMEALARMPRDDQVKTLLVLAEIDVLLGS